MNNDNKPDLLGWLGMRSTPAYQVARWMGPAISLVIILLILLAIITAFMVLIQAIFFGLPNTPGAGLGTGALAVAIIGAPFVIWRAIVAQKTVDVQEQGLITDRINKAVQGLGTEKTVIRNGEEWSEPNLEVRIGAIYALERIAQDSARDHVQIMEILCAYIRHNAPAPAEDNWPELEMKAGEDDGPLEADWAERLKAFEDAQAEAKAKLKVREDIQVALNVLGRRRPEQRLLEAQAFDAPEGAEFVFDNECPDYDGPRDGYDQPALEAFKAKIEEWKDRLYAYRGYRLDLRSANLRGADLFGLNLAGARLNGTHLQGAILWGTNLTGALLNYARLDNADLRNANIGGAALWMVGLQGADLRGTRLQRADIVETRMQGANLSAARLHRAMMPKVMLQGADMRMAQLQGAYLQDARMQNADVRAARLQGVDLKKARLHGAHFLKARMQGATFVGTRMYGCSLVATSMDGVLLRDIVIDEHTRINEANLTGSAIKDADISRMRQLAEHLPKMFGDGTVILPPEIDRPLHWPKRNLSTIEFDREWRRWQADPESYAPQEELDGCQAP